jgi:hypothetical protein
MATLTERMIRAARLDVGLYEEVEADKDSMGQATSTVVLASAAAGVGSFADGGVAGIVIVTLGSLLGWYVWAYLTYVIGTRMLAEPQTKADLGELLRTIGFASSPGLIRVVGVIPGLHALVFTAASVWMLVAMIIAVRQALDFTATWRAVAVCLIGWTVQILILAALFIALGMPARP